MPVSLIPFSRGQTVIEVIVDGGMRRENAVKLIWHDDDTVKTEGGDLYDRATGAALTAKNGVYRAIHTPDYEAKEKG